MLKALQIAETNIQQLQVESVEMSICSSIFIIESKY